MHKKKVISLFSCNKVTQKKIKNELFKTLSHSLYSANKFYMKASYKNLKYKYIKLNELFMLLMLKNV